MVCSLALRPIQGHCFPLRYNKDIIDRMDAMEQLGAALGGLSLCSRCERRLAAVAEPGQCRTSMLYAVRKLHERQCRGFNAAALPLLHAVPHGLRRSLDSSSSKPSPNNNAIATSSSSHSAPRRLRCSSRVHGMISQLSTMGELAVGCRQDCS